MMDVDFPVTWALRLFMIQAGVLIGALGWYWMKPGPQFRSRYGMLFAVALKSDEHWKELHRRLGKLLLLIGVILLVPLPTVQMTMKIQIPLIAGIWLLGIVVVKNRMERFRIAARADSDKTDGEESKRLV